MQCNIDSLPDEILEYILSLISPYKDLNVCLFVSRRWWELTKNVMERNTSHFKKSVSYGRLFWTPLKCVQLSPMITKRHSHSACIFEDSMYVFGGCTASSTAFNDFWRLDLNTRRWLRPTTIGNYPSPKACASMVVYKGKFILFGGWSQPSSYSIYQPWKIFNELHVYTIHDNRWELIENVPESPPPLSAHSASVHKNFMVVFGGMVENGSTNDVWCLNLDTYCWHKQRTSVLQPHSRYGQSQIEIDDTHLLIIGGCTGPNFSINDVWLLTMEGLVWQWRKVNVLNPENAPKRILYHQACKAGDHVIVLGKKKFQLRDMKIFLPQLNSRGVLPDVNNPVPSYERPSKAPPVDRDVNVNGRRGVLPRAYRRNTDSLPSSTFVLPASIPMISNEKTQLSMVAFHQTAQHRAEAYQRRRTESIRKMERMRCLLKAPKLARHPEDTLAIYILDISKVLHEECTASWIPWKTTNQVGPDERILYSLVLGKGELIVFGGIRKDKITIQGETILDESEVYNDLHFINPPKYKI